MTPPTPLDNYALDQVQLGKELAEFAGLLAAKGTLRERDDVLPFFKARAHLSAFVGTTAPDVVRPDRVRHEFSLLGDFSADLVVGDSHTKTFCFVEFEEGAPGGVFRKGWRKGATQWTPRFEHAFGQVIDWFNVLEDVRRTDVFAKMFGAHDIRYSGILVIGRSAGITAGDMKRLAWRSQSVSVNGRPVMCQTYDQLLESLQHRLAAYQAWAKG